MDSNEDPLNYGRGKSRRAKLSQADVTVSAPDGRDLSQYIISPGDLTLAKIDQLPSAVARLKRQK